VCACMYKMRGCVVYVCMYDTRVCMMRERVYVCMQNTRECVCVMYNSEVSLLETSLPAALAMHSVPDHQISQSAKPYSLNPAAQRLKPTA
jgi:hypothetical protein